MTRALWLPEVLRAAGLTVYEVDGWETRGSTSYDPKGIICHATAGATNSSDSGEIRVLLEGSNTAPPPIAQLYLSRTGAFHVVASGKCYHALTGWGGPLKGLGNTNLIGIEAANDNRGEPWPDVQLDAYQRGVAAICKHMGWTADRNVAAHREHQPYPPPSWTTSSKSDPAGIDMTAFRARVGALIAGEDPDDMTRDEFIEHFKAAMSDPTVTALMRARPWQYPVRSGVSALNALFVEALPGLQAGQKTLGEAIARESSSPAEVRALLDELPEPQPVDVNALAAAVTEQVVAALPTGGQVSREDLEAALRTVLGSLDATQ